MTGVRVYRVAAIAVGAVILAGCGSSHASAGKGTRSTSSSAPATRTPPSTDDATLSRAKFVTKANAFCHRTYAKVHALPVPQNATDYPAIIANIRGTFALYPPFSRDAKTLIAQSADKNELIAKWISLDDADFAAQRPLLQQMLAAALAAQANRVQRLGDQLNQTPNHTDAIVAFLRSYGLTDCAKLESA